MRIYTIVIKTWLQTSVNFNVQFEIKISRVSKNYCQKKISHNTLSVYQSYKEKQEKGERKKAQRAVFGRRRYFNFHLPRKRQSFRNSQTTPAKPSSLLNQILTVHFHPFRLSLIQRTTNPRPSIPSKILFSIPFASIRWLANRSR